MVDPKEARAEARKILRCTAKVVGGNGTQVSARTMDISMSGISLMVAEPLAPSQQYTIVFDAFANEKLIKVNAPAKVVYCICVGTSGFRVGFQFDQKNEIAMRSIRQLLQ